MKCRYENAPSMLSSCHSDKIISPGYAADEVSSYPVCIRGGFPVDFSSEVSFSWENPLMYPLC